jgi:hypothetical protein
MPSDILCEIDRGAQRTGPFGQNGLQEGMELFRAHHRLLQLREKKYSFIVK